MISASPHRFDIDEKRIQAAATRRWKNVKDVKTGAPYWIDVDYSTVRVSVQFDGDCCFGANFNYRTGEFD